MKYFSGVYSEGEQAQSMMGCCFSHEEISTMSQELGTDNRLMKSSKFSYLLDVKVTTNNENIRRIIIYV